MKNPFTDLPDDEVEYLDLVRFNVFGYINDEFAREFTEALFRKDDDDPKAVWEVVINSEGGDMESGTAIFSELRAYSERGGGNHHVITRVRGQAASCAALILQAGDKRSAGKMDYIMLHEPMMTFTDATLQRVRDELRQADSWIENFLDVVMERGSADRKFYAKNLSGGRDWWLSSSEALELGLIDEVA